MKNYPCNCYQLLKSIILNPRMAMKMNCIILLIRLMNLLKTLNFGKYAGLEIIKARCISQLVYFTYHLVRLRTR